MHVWYEIASMACEYSIILMRAEKEGVESRGGGQLAFWQSGNQPKCHHAKLPNLKIASILFLFNATFQLQLSSY
jgi:hypothetical protein